MSATGEMSRTYVATASFDVTVDGRVRKVVAGVTRVREGDSLLVGRVNFFERASVGFPDVEAATDVPGERRGQ